MSGVSDTNAAAAHSTTADADTYAGPDTLDPDPGNDAAKCLCGAEAI